MGVFSQYCTLHPQWSPRRHVCRQERVSPAHSPTSPGCRCRRCSLLTLDECDAKEVNSLFKFLRKRKVNSTGPTYYHLQKHMMAVLDWMIFSQCQCRSELRWQDCEQLALGLLLARLGKYAEDTLHKLHPWDPHTGSHFVPTHHQHCLILLLVHTLQSFRRGLSSPQPRLLDRLLAG